MVVLEFVKNLWVVAEELYFPLSEILWQLVVVCVRHHVFLNALVALDFLEDGVGIGIGHVDDHPGLSAVHAEGFAVIVHFGDQDILGVLELEGHVSDKRSIA